MSLISKFDNNMNIIGYQLKKYRQKQNLSYEQLSAKLDLLGISIHKQSLYV
jgi:transcriptional regulator with XRE-family HTH domain